MQCISLFTPSTAIHCHTKHTGHHDDGDLMGGRLDLDESKLEGGGSRGTHVLLPKYHTAPPPFAKFTTAYKSHRDTAPHLRKVPEEQSL